MINLGWILSAFGDFVGNGAFAQWSKISIFHNIFEFMISRGPQRALLWSNGVKSIKGKSQQMWSVLLSTEIIWRPLIIHCVPESGHSGRSGLIWEHIVCLSNYINKLTTFVIVCSR